MGSLEFETEGSRRRERSGKVGDGRRRMAEGEQRSVRALWSERNFREPLFLVLFDVLGRQGWVGD